MANDGVGRSLEWRGLSFPMVGGVDTKVDGIAIQPPRLKHMLNAYVEHTGALRKRCGYANLTTSDTAGSTFTDARALAAYQGRLQAFGGGGRAYEYGSNAAKWAPKGSVTYGARLSSRSIPGASDTGPFGNDGVRLNGYNIDAWAESYEDAAGNDVVSVKLSVSDDDGTVYVNGATLQTTTSALADLGGVRVVSRGDIVFVFWFRDSTKQIRVLDIDTGGGIATLLSDVANPPTTVTADCAAVGFDVASNANEGIIVAYPSTTANTVKWGIFTTGLAFIDTSTYVAASQPLAVAVAVSPGMAMHGICYILGGAANNVFALHRNYNSGAHTWTATATSTGINVGAVATSATISCEYDSNTSLRIWYTEGANPANLSTDLGNFVYNNTYSTAGVIGTRARVIGKSVAVSKPFSYGGEWFIWVVQGRLLSTLQPTYYAVRSSDGAIVAHACPGLAFPFSLLFGVQARVTVVGSVASANFLNLRKIVALGTFIASGTETAQKALSISFADADSMKTGEQGKALLLAAGILGSYDGAAWSENQPLRFVEGGTINTSFTATPGAFVTTATYYYWVVYEWKDEQGLIVQGAIDAPTGITQGATAFEVKLAIPTLTATNRTDAVIAVYRSGPNAAPTDTAYRVGSVANDKTVAEVLFYDDGSTTLAEPIYLTDEVDNIAPPAAHIMTCGNGRVWLAGFEDEPNMVRFSKTRQPGQGVVFTDEFQVLLPSDGGPITALEMINETLVIFLERRVYTLDTRGGPSNAINNQQAFGEPHLVSADTGCYTQRSVVLTPMGVLFQPVAGKAPYLLDQAFQLSYVGAPVEDYFDAGESVVSSILDPERQHVRYALSGGTWCVFDYYHKHWSVFRYAASIAATGPLALYGGQVAAPLTGGRVGLEAAALFTDADADYLLLAKLAWVADPTMRLGSVRFRTLGFVGMCKGASRLLATVYRNYDESSASDSLDSGALAPSATKAFRVFRRLSKQLAHAMEIVVTEEAGNASESFTLTAVEFELAARKPVFGRPIPSGS